MADVHGVAEMIGFGSSPYEVGVTLELTCLGKSRTLQEIMYIKDCMYFGAQRHPYRGSYSRCGPVKKVAPHNRGRS